MTDQPGCDVSRRGCKCGAVICPSARVAQHDRITTRGNGCVERGPRRRNAAAGSTTCSPCPFALSPGHEKRRSSCPLPGALAPCQRYGSNHSVITSTNTNSTSSSQLAVIIGTPYIRRPPLAPVIPGHVPARNSHGNRLEFSANTTAAAAAAQPCAALRRRPPA